jgi:8-oxo-dGTP pyrophosphatase MutT (NUDIX family)
MTYRHQALRQLRPAEEVPGSVFVTVLLPTEGGLAAARELAEELGIRVADEELRLWGLTRGTRFGSLGFHVLAPPVPSALVRRRHADLTVSETECGDVPELDKIAFVLSAEQAAGLGSGADYLHQVLAQYFST